LQAKLLRVVERGELRRVGGNRWLTVDVRVLCATRRDLDREVAAGRFRDDLFHRLAVARIELPPLRNRTGDVDLLARHFYAQAGGRGALGAAVMAKWAEEPWPGNVRELRNNVQKLVAIGDVPLPTDEDTPLPSSRGDLPERMPDLIGEVVAEGLPLAEARARVVAELERRYLERLLKLHGGNVSHAAAASGIARRHLQRLRAKSR
jgi:DNA-binding NtrC family response regulator